jgi:hypothetical protein
VEGIQFGLDSRTENVSRNACGINTDGAVIHGGDVAFDVNSSLVGGGLVTANSNAGGDEVT